MTAPTFFGVSTIPADNGSLTEPQTNYAITPPASMQAGDLVVLVAYLKGTAGAPSLNNTGGQTWNVGGITSNFGPSFRLTACVFNGTWTSDPTLDFPSASGTQPCGAQMLVFRPDSTSKIWAEQSSSSSQFTAPSTPFTVTISPDTPTNNDNVVFAAWISDDDNTWASLSGSGWSQTGLTAQYRNTGGADASTAYAYQLQGTAAAPNAVSLNQDTLGGDAGYKIWAIYYAYASGQGTGAATGTGTATGIVSAVGTAAGVGAATGRALSIGAASGIGDASGDATPRSDAAASGTGTANGLALSTGAATGAGVATGIVTAVGASSGTGAADGLALALGAASGTGVATGLSVSLAAAAGTGVADGLALSVGAAAGVGEATGAAIVDSAGAASGTGSATGIVAAIGAASGAGTATGLLAAVGSADGVGAATGLLAALAASAGVGQASAFLAALGASDGTGSASGVISAVAAAAGVGQADGVSGAASTAEAAGTSSAAAFSVSTGAASGVGAASAVSSGEADQAATGGGWIDPKVARSLLRKAQAFQRASERRQQEDEDKRKARLAALHETMERAYAEITGEALPPTETLLDRLDQPQPEDPNKAVADAIAVYVAVADLNDTGAMRAALDAFDDAIMRLRVEMAERDDEEVLLLIS